MATHLSIATAIDKNKLASATVYLLLLEVDVFDLNGNMVETIYATCNNEDYTFKGQLYRSLPFEIQLQQEREALPTAQLVVYDLLQVFQAALQAYAVSLDWPARIMVINTANPSPSVDVQYNFVITAAVAKDTDYSITFTLAGENPLTLRWPPRQQFRNRCFWLYQSAQCAYSKTPGTLTTSGPTVASTFVNLVVAPSFRGTYPVSGAGLVAGDTLTVTPGDPVGTLNNARSISNATVLTLAAYGSCDFTSDGTNGCAFHGNTFNFGGFPGISKSIT